MIAIAAMALNRVIGKDGRIPWHLSGDLKFFKRTTLGHAVVMGRKTFESIGKPLPGRENIVLSRHEVAVPGVVWVRKIDEIPKPGDARKVFVIGGAEVYKRLLPECDELLLTVVKLEPPGDVYFPAFEKDFDLAGILEETGDYEVRRYLRREG